MPQTQVPNLPLQARCVIIIVIWNCWDHVHRCLDALKKQTCRDYRIIVVDNGDSTPDQVARACCDERVTYLKNSENLGFAAGNNRGFELTRDVAPFVALLNPDTIPSPEWLETMLEAAAANPEYAAFGCRMLQAGNPALLDGEGDSYHISGFAWRAGIGLKAQQSNPKPWETFSPCAAAALYRSDAFDGVGGFDEDFFCYMEDVDLGFRLRLAGYRCLIVPQAEVMHVGSATTGKRSAFYVYYGQRNLIWTFIKNMPGILFWFFLPAHIVLNLAAVLYCALRGQAGTVLRAKYDALAAMPVVWRKRKKIQAMRVSNLGDVLKALDKRPIPGLGRAVSSLWK